jgi:hypothetical protein
MSKRTYLYFKSMESAREFAKTAPGRDHIGYGIFTDTDGEYQCIKVYDNQNTVTQILIVDENLYNRVSYQERGE